MPSGNPAIPGPSERPAHITRKVTTLSRFSITCPLKTLAGWSELARDRPNLFGRACDLEETLNARRAALDRDEVFLTRTGRPLADAISAAQDELPFDPGCDSGWCMT